MSSASFRTIRLASEAIDSRDDGGGVPTAPPKKSVPRSAATSSKRAEDTGAGCRAKAAADLARALAPGGDFMRVRLEQSAAVWAERASLLERLEKNFQQRMPTA